MARNDNKQQIDQEWVEDALANFENLYPGLIEKISTISTQYQVRLSMFPQSPAGEASSNTSEQL